MREAGRPIGGPLYHFRIGIAAGADDDDRLAGKLLPRIVQAAARAAAPPGSTTSFRCRRAKFIAASTCIVGDGL